MSIAPKIRWGLLGAGNIAKIFAAGIAHSATGVLAAIGTRDPKKPGLAENFPGARVHDGYEALLADDGCDAIYVATPHPGHAEWVLKAIARKKHVLVEKPMALSAFEADALIHAARGADVFLGEAFMYRVHPQTQKLVELIKADTIGEVRLIRSSFGFAMPAHLPEHRLYANALAGGGILDVGCYPVSMARLIAGAAQGKSYLEPEIVQGVAHLGQTGVDEWASAVLRFSGGILAELSCSISLAQDNMLRIFGTKGAIEVKDFWFASGKEGGTGIIDVLRPDGRDAIETITEKWLYAFEVDAVGDALREGRRQFSAPGPDWQDSLGNMRVLDKWRAAVGLEYEVEKPALRTKTLKGASLAIGERRIPTRTVPGLGKSCSAAALGFEDFRSFSSAAILLDAFFEAGGNLFDTAFVYGGGVTETLFGQWHRARGVREQTVLIGKGAHSPLCRPEFIGAQLDQSLARLDTDYIDVYFMHRDNPAVPVGEFVDAMDAEVRAGRIRGPFGGSNWTRERFDEAIAYAERTGKRRPSALSNNFALAEMLDPIWEGCVSSSSEEWRRWLVGRQVANFSWSSQARGFFTERAGRDRRGDDELVRVWYSERNFVRRDRAIALAKELGRRPIHIALAYVLAQPFVSVPLIGPRTLAELDDSLEAFDFALTAEQVTWLEG